MKPIFNSESSNWSFNKENCWAVVQNRQAVRTALGTSTFTDLATVRQDEINELVKSHLDCEARYGRKLHPAARNQGVTQDGQDDDDCT